MCFCIARFVLESTHDDDDLFLVASEKEHELVSSFEMEQLWIWCDKMLLV